jgi:senataxin
MHPMISRFPSRIFYQGRIKDGPDMVYKSMAPWHASSVFAPFVFFDACDGEEKSIDGRSYINVREANSRFERYYTLYFTVY